MKTRAEIHEQAQAADKGRMAMRKRDAERIAARTFLCVHDHKHRTREAMERCEDRAQ